MNAFKYECRIKTRKEEWFSMIIAFLIVGFILFNLYLYTEDTNLFKVILLVINRFME